MSRISQAEIDEFIRIGQHLHLAVLNIAPKLWGLRNHSKAEEYMFKRRGLQDVTWDWLFEPHGSYLLNVRSEPDGEGDYTSVAVDIREMNDPEGYLEKETEYFRAEMERKAKKEAEEAERWRKTKEESDRKTFEALKEEYGWT